MVFLTQASQRTVFGIEAPSVTVNCASDQLLPCEQFNRKEVAGSQDIPMAFDKFMPCRFYH
jgi:hypothetical protein